MAPGQWDSTELYGGNDQEIHYLARFWGYSYVQRHITEDLAKDELTNEDWSVLRDIHELLDCLLQTTLALESHDSTLDTVLPAMDFVLEQFEIFKEKHPALGPMFDLGWAKAISESSVGLRDLEPFFPTGANVED